MQTDESRVAALDRIKAAMAQQRRAYRLSDERFDKTHELFERCSGQQRLILEWLTDLIRSDFASLDPLRILSVGCGSGILDNPLIESVAKTSKRLDYTGVDPNGVACRRFQNGFDKLELANVRLDLRQQQIETLRATDRFDLIHAVHSLYYFDDPAATLGCLLSLLAPGGKLVVVQAPHAELNQLANCFWGHQADNGIWFSDCVARHLSQRRLRFTRQRIDGEVDVARCFEAECPRGEMMLDFITQSDCRQFDDEILELCLSYLRAVSRVDEDSLFVSHPADAFIIPDYS